MDRIMIAAPSSGVGKTTITCLILELLKKRGLNIAGFKCGPDYIDPMFHESVLGIKTTNLDSYLMSGETIRALLARNYRKILMSETPGALGGAPDKNTIAVIEGVMGYYDGLGMSDEGSTYSVARATDTPVVMVIDCKGTSRSAAAVLRGLKEYRDDSRIRGVIFNRVSERVYAGLREEATALGVTPVGYVSSVKDASLPSRHLGLVMPGEIRDFKERLSALEEKAVIDIDALLELARDAAGTDAGDLSEGSEKAGEGRRRVRIALARDEAFCFYYSDVLSLFKECGAQPVEFSPIRDARLPEGVCGLILGGGYPELHLKELNENSSMRSAVKRALESGMPVYAECGGFMYLHERIYDMEGTPFDMVGAIEGECRYTDRLQSFGYEELVMEQHNPLFEAGTRVRAHEFHRYVSGAPQEAMTAIKNNVERKTGTASDTMLAMFPHLHLYSYPGAVERFIKTCEEYGASQNI